MVMDKLSCEVTKALAEGMSYGKWKAKQEIVSPDKRDLPKGWILCQWCGKPFKPAHVQRYCSQPCRHEANKEKNRERMAERRRIKKI